MSASSIAAVAVGASPFSLSSAYSIDQFSVRSLIPPPILWTSSKIRSCVKYSPFYAVKCASTVFDGIDLNKEENEADEDEEDSGVGEIAVSEVGEKVSDSAKSPVDGGRLYVGNLPFSMTSTQLSEIFAEAGHVVSVEVVYDRVTDRSRGFAFVTMSTIDEAKEAIRLFDGAQLGGRTAKVNFPEVPRGGEREVMIPKIRSSYQGFVDSPYKIYAGNLSWALTSQGLRDAFSNQPGFLSAKVIYDRDSGRSRGFGFVTFSSAQEVESAINAMNGVELEGRPLRLNVAEQKASNMSNPEAENREQASSVA